MPLVPFHAANASDGHQVCQAYLGQAVLDLMNQPLIVDVWKEKLHQFDKGVHREGICSKGVA